MKNEIYGFDAFSPAEIAERIEKTGVTKARLPFLSLFMLGALAGGFIALGALYSTLIFSDHSLPFGVSRILGGIAFSLGLILVVVAGAELFTGNNLLVMAWADGKISLKELVRNWTIVLLSNFAGSVVVALLVSLSNHTDMNNKAVLEQYIRIAQYKCSLNFSDAFISGLMCNVLVCLAVWMSQAGRSVMDKALVIIFPISAFVAAGFEHSIANMYFIPLGIVLKESYTGDQAVHLIDGMGFVSNIVPVILGNLTGGSLLVALVYYLIYRRKNLFHRKEETMDIPS
ncbi:MAG: formate/nitrite transporter family protein [Saprospiraceae bacterium]|nr:formate/nitrite transporter family protein [Saprospiraceae bacterium]